MTKLLPSLIVLAATPTGCALYTLGVAVVTPAPAVVVAPAPGSGFCPPGQAKKGRC